MGINSTDVSVVICAYTEDRWQDLITSVDSVNRQDAPRETIVVVDNNPRLLERARAQFRDIQVIANTQVPGLAGARNSGLAAAAGDIVAFLDDDAVADHAWLRNLCSVYDDPSITGVGGAIEPRFAEGRPSWFPDEFGWVVGCNYRGMPEQLAAVRNLTGCNMSFRRAAVESVGGFRLGYGCDETELCIRIRQKFPSAVLLYTPAARVLHRVSGSRSRWKYFSHRCYYEGGSKAVVSRMLGSRDALSSERTYTLHTLPHGVLRGILDTVVKNDRSGLARAFAIIAGLAITTGGYAEGKLFADRTAKRRGLKPAELAAS